MKAGEILQTAKDIVEGDRADNHGAMWVNHANIAALWAAYLGEKPGGNIEEHDVAVMMALLKIARTKTGKFNPDDYVDAAGYMGIAGQLIGSPNITTSTLAEDRPHSADSDASGA